MILSTILPLPKEILNCEKLFIIPSYSLINKLGPFSRQLSGESHVSIKDSKLIFDYLRPKIINENILVIGPILGADGISHILRTIFSHPNNKIKSTFFFGTAGSTRSEIQIGSIHQPKGFLVESSNNTYEVIKNDALNILSTAKVSLSREMKTEAKIQSLNQTYEISLIDMECSYIAKICTKYQVPFDANIIVSDSCDNSPKKITQLDTFEDFVKIVFSKIKSLA